jgi:hypothetical protein
VRSEKRSGTTTASRNELQTLLDFLWPRYVLMIARIDRLLYGAAAIAGWMCMTYGHVKPLIDAEIIPTFKPPGRTVRYALKARSKKHFTVLPIELG